MSKTKVSTVLTRALKRIKKGWCQENYAIDKNGEDVDPCGDKAVAWCALGAIDSIIPNEFSIINDCEKTLLSMIKGNSISHWNDAKKRTKEEVVALFEKAIAKAKKKEANKK